MVGKYILDRLKKVIKRVRSCATKDRIETYGHEPWLRKMAFEATKRSEVWRRSTSLSLRDFLRLNVIYKEPTCPDAQSQLTQGTRVNEARSTISLSCAGIGCEKWIEILGPEGWVGHAAIRDLYCENCKLHEEFFRTICLGCKGGYFSDCELKKKFEGSLWEITSNDLETIRQGLCPSRVCDDIAISLDFAWDEMKEEEERKKISNKATKEAGEAVAAGLLAHHKKYKECYEAYKKIWE